MTEIDAEKDVYLFTHGRMDLQEKSINALLANGFSKDKIIMALPNKLGSVDDTWQCCGCHQIPTI